jgi:hypothetical protein
LPATELYLNVVMNCMLFKIYFADHNVFAIHACCCICQ